MRPAAEERRRILRAVSLCTLGLGLLAVAASYVLASYQGVDYKCITSGPFHPGAVVSEGDIVVGGFSWWPLGRSCEWDRADGNGRLSAQSGSFPASAITYTLIAGGTLGAAASVVRRPQG